MIDKQCSVLHLHQWRISQPLKLPPLCSRPPTTKPVSRSRQQPEFALVDVLEQHLTETDYLSQARGAGKGTCNKGESDCCTKIGYLLPKRGGASASLRAYITLSVSISSLPIKLVGADCAMSLGPREFTAVVGCQGAPTASCGGAFFFLEFPLRW